MRYADFGSVSSGTLRDEDLLAAFSCELEYQLKRQPTRFKRAEYRQLLREAVRASKNINDDDGYSGVIIDELQSALDDFAPPYGYFGIVEGDGTEFGFWLSSYCLENAKSDGILVVGDHSDLPKGYTGEWFHVNDHGNVTLYVRNKRGKDRVIWSVV